MCKCDNRPSTVCSDICKPQKPKFEAGQTWRARNGLDLWLVVAFAPDGRLIVAKKGHPDSLSYRKPDGSVGRSAEWNSQSPNDLISLHVEPKTYEVNVYVYEYDAGRISYGAYTPEFAEKISAHKSTYLKAIKKLKIAEGEGL